MHDHLHSVDRGEPPDFPYPSWRSAQRFCASVKRRTGASAWFDRDTRRFYFGYHRTDGTFDLTALSVVYRELSTGLAGDGSSSEENIVRMLQMAKLPVSRKDRMAAAVKAESDHERSEELGRSVESASREADVQVERQYERHTMGKHFRRSHLVSGLKG